MSWPLCVFSVFRSPTHNREHLTERNGLPSASPIPGNPTFLPDVRKPSATMQFPSRKRNGQDHRKRPHPKGSAAPGTTFPPLVPSLPRPWTHIAQRETGSNAC